MIKKGAVELSFTTIVVLVLAMTMLILGIVLIRGIFTGATDNVKSIDEKVRGEINKLFSEDNNQEIVIYPISKLIKIKQGSDSEGFAFAIRNLDTKTATFGWSVEVSDADLKTKCPGLTETEVKRWIVAGRTGTVTLASGNIMPNGGRAVLFTLPKTAPTCTISLTIIIQKDNLPYTQEYIDLTVKAA